VGYGDYTMGGATNKAAYIRRHRAREVWTKSGIATPGFWSRWLLWNKPSLAASKHDMRDRFCLQFA